MPHEIPVPRMLSAKALLVNEVDLPPGEVTQRRKNKQLKMGGKGLGSDGEYKVLWKHTGRASDTRRVQEGATRKALWRE